MSLFQKECYRNSSECFCVHAHSWMYVFTCASALFWDPDLTDAEKEKDRKKALRLRWTVFVLRPGGRLLELGDESRKRPLIYCTVHCCKRWIAPPLLFSPTVFFTSMPVSEWCIRVRRGWVLGGSEQPAPTHRGLRHMRSGEDLEKE